MDRLTTFNDVVRQDVDLADYENVKQARHELDRAETAADADAALARWARKWGGAALVVIHDAHTNPHSDLDLDDDD